MEKKANYYPPIDPYATHMLQVSDLHTLYVEESGNPDGIPVVHIHGGPSSQSKPGYRQHYDPKMCRIILYDQRGCGKSTPFGSMEENTLTDLVEDLERIRNFLGIEKRIIQGGSWGSTLAIEYAKCYPGKIYGLILVSIALFDGPSIDRLTQGVGSSIICPDYWDTLVKASGRDTVPVALYERVLNRPVEEVDRILLKAFMEFDYALLKKIDEAPLSFEVSDNDIISWKLFLRYAKNDFFLARKGVLSNIEKIQGIPTVIIHGRYDQCCTLHGARQLAQMLPAAAFEIVEDAGHRGGEPGIAQKVIDYAEQFVQVIT